MALMSDALPKIRVTDSLGRDGDSTSILLSPTTEDGQPAAASRSATSPESNPHPTYIRRSAVKSAIETVKREPSNPPKVLPGKPEYSIDPLSHHILKRTNTENTIPQKLQRPPTQPLDQDVPDIETPTNVAEESVPRQSIGPDILRTESKDKKKGVSVSFLSRFKKKSDQPEYLDGEDSDPSDRRTEGMNAHVFSSSIGAIGYTPQHKDPSYIKVRAHYKKERDFGRMFLAQELKGTDQSCDSNGGSVDKKGKLNSTVWSTEFSQDGKYLAAAGHDHIVRIWAVISTPEERQEHEAEEDASNSRSGGQGERLHAPVFRSKPIREYEGHTGDVLDLSWSKNNFLLSSSMDKTVRLWHVSRQECLCTFKHRDFVTSIAFHPKDDRFFLAGSLDSVLRLWSIPDKSVAFRNQLPGLITAVAFTPDGKTAMAGIITGMCLFYDTEGLKYNTQIHVRSSRGRNAKGSKITSIRTMTFPPNDPDGDLKLLITTNDSRVRLYSFRDKSLEMKFKGNSNTCSQINASFSDNGKYVICGSEDKRVYIWSTSAVDLEMKDKRPLEDFRAHQDIVTTAIFAPTKTRQLLGASEDPLYDLCNPPPVTLVSREESYSVKPSEPERPASDSIMEMSKKPAETPAYIARSLHPGGNIIVTADFTGNIKVFRQDCAFNKRRHDQWETQSAFSKKIGGSMMGRSSSNRTKNSDRSRRNSLTTQPSNPSHGFGAQHPEHRILSWRNSVGSILSAESNHRGRARTAGSASISASLRSERSISPGKFSASSTTLTETRVSMHSQAPGGSAKEARQLPYGNRPAGNARGAPSIAAKSIRSNSPPPTRGSIHSSAETKDVHKKVITTKTIPPIQHPSTPSFTRAPTMRLSTTENKKTTTTAQEATEEQKPLKIDPTGRSYNFWNPASWSRASANTTLSSSSSNIRPETSAGLLGANILGGWNKLERTRSVVSKLSSDEDASRDDDVGGQEETMMDEVEEQEVKCKRCGGKEFRARKVIANPRGGTGQKLVCGKCGLICE